MPSVDNTPPSTPPPPAGEHQSLVTERSALVFLTAGFVATLLGALTYLQTHNAAAAGIAAILGFGGTIPIADKTIR